MDKNNTTDFLELVREISTNKILLPDFQRGFEWKEEEQQRKIVASVLAKMPIGSILLLKSKPDEYGTKQIGNINPLNTDDMEGVVQFLLDGQQRITVLTNVFSNIIHEKCPKVGELSSPSLKRRFFLRIPRWSAVDEQDLFGVRNLEFTVQNPDNEDPEFLSGDILSFVEVIDFKANDGRPYNPQVKLSTALDDFCLSYEKGYLIPLFLLAPADGPKKDIFISKYNSIIEEISRRIGAEIVDAYMSLESDEDKEKLVVSIFNDKEVYERISSEETTLKDELYSKVNMWRYYLNNYLMSCLRNVLLNKIVVSESQRDRAIDIYENMNRGGVSLSTFDLIMARVAKVSSDNFFRRLCAYIQTNREYTKTVLPDKIEAIIADRIDKKEYNAAMSTGCYNQSKNELASKYIDAFLDVLSLYCYNPALDPNFIKLEYIKRNKILSLEPTEIDTNAEKVCIAIDRALFFFQTRCGIRNIQEINYQLMLVLVATVFMKDEYFVDKEVHKILESWYWSSIFSGRFDKDQNDMLIQDLKLMLKTLSKENDKTWIKGINDYVLNAQNFSDEKLLLFEKLNEERTPKAILRTFMCQYLLSKTYADMFDASNIISVFSEEAATLQAHHIIPLGSEKKVGESTAVLRKNKTHICNSPLNFVYITRNSNREISDKDLKAYADMITSEAKAALFITAFAGGAYDADFVKAILKDRFTYMKGDIKGHITSLLQ